MLWSIDTFDFTTIDEKSRGDELLFFLVASASFVESAAETYTDNLIRRFGDRDAALQTWLRGTWQHEECRHGAVLRRYVETLWPDFAWARAYESFLAEYSTVATDDALNAFDALEMYERCIVETGTSSLYAMLGAYTQDPLLQTICRNIHNDEIGHYKRFLHYFNAFNQNEKHSRLHIFKTLISRAREMQGDDSRIAFKHIYRFAHGAEPAGKMYESYVHRVGVQVVQPYFPYKTAAELVTRPLRLPGRVQKGVTSAVHVLARRFFFAA